LGFGGLYGSFGLFGRAQKMASNPSTTFSTFLTSFLGQPKEFFDNRQIEETG
jgi:hypothetical protein